MEFKKSLGKNFSIESTIAKDFFDGIKELIVSSLKNFSMELYGGKLHCQIVLQ